MLLRARPGDLAVITRSPIRANLGALIRVEAQDGPGAWRVRTLQTVRAMSPSVVGAIFVLYAGQTLTVRDDQLRSLRITARDDETFGWPCGRPPKTPDTTSDQGGT